MSEVGVSKGTWEFFVNCSVNFKEIKKTLKKSKVKTMAMQSTQFRLWETEDKQPNFFKKQIVKK